VAPIAQPILLHLASHPSFSAPILEFLANWRSSVSWLLEYRGVRRKREKTKLALCFADLEVHAVAPRARSDYYCELLAFMHIESFSKVTPTPGVYYYLWDRIKRRARKVARSIGDFLTAVTNSDWFATQAATWIHHIALYGNMMWLTPEYRDTFDSLGCTAPVRRTTDPFHSPWPITPQPKQRLLAVHETIDWDEARYTIYDFSTAIESTDAQKNRWVPFELMAETVDGEFRCLGVSAATVIRRKFLADDGWVSIVVCLPDDSRVTIRQILQAAQTNALRFPTIS